MKPVDLVTEALSVRAAALLWSRCVARAAALSAFCGALAACGSVDDLGGAPIDEATENTGVDQEALVDANGLFSNGLDSNGLDWNGLDSNGLYSNGLVTATVQNWLQTQASALAAMPYLVSCAAPSGTTVGATVNGVDYSWPGALGLAPGWVNNTPMSLAQQEWVSACLLAHVNLAGKHVMVSFRSADATIATTASERSDYKCREAAFMGNLFGGRLNTDPLPLVQCRDNGAQTGTGRACDPNQKSYSCAVDCYAACDKSSDAFSSCSVSVNGSLRNYSRVVTTYLPTDPAQGCPGWGYDIRSRGASFYSSGGGSNWNWGWGWSVSSSSCSQHCGGYASSGACSCAPDCAANGTCCGDYASLCGTPPPYVAPTSGQSSCPAGYSTYNGSLGGSGSVSYWPSSSGYTVTLSGAQHATLLGPSASNFDLTVQTLRSDGNWSDAALSDRNGSSESIHYFYGKKDTTYRWKISSRSGAGAYTLCMNDLRGNTLKNVNSNECVSASGGGVTNSTPITQQSCVSSSYQGWRLQSVGTNRYVFQNVNSGKCLDVPGGNPNSGVMMQEWDCNGTTAQMWDAIPAADGSKSFRSVASGKCLDVYGWSTSDGGQIAQWDCHYGANQRYWVQ